jgi:uncharacterized protein YndB with AHSA1/START domain
MPTDKDFKRLVRARMTRTGESYTTARAQLVRRHAASGRPVSPSASSARVPAAVRASAAPASPADFPRLAGMSDAAVKAKTGCTWERWVSALDRASADRWPHHEIAKYVREKYKMSSWWSQTVTVGYERIKGLRAVGQRRDGGFEASRSRTLAVPVSRLYRAFRDARTRSRWLGGATLTFRTATKDRSLRIAWPDGTSVQAMFYPRGTDKSQVQIQHGRLADRGAADAVRQFWGERLEALAEILARTASRSRS